MNVAQQTHAKMALYVKIHPDPIIVSACLVLLGGTVVVGNVVIFTKQYV